MILRRLTNCPLPCTRRRGARLKCSSMGTPNDTAADSPIFIDDLVCGNRRGGTNLKVVAVSAGGDVLQRLSVETQDAPGSVPKWPHRVREIIAEFEHSIGESSGFSWRVRARSCGRDARSIAHMPGRLAGLVGIDWTNALGRPSVVPVLNDAQAALVGGGMDWRRQESAACRHADARNRNRRRGDG